LIYMICIENLEQFCNIVARPGVLSSKEPFYDEEPDGAAVQRRKGLRENPRTSLNAEAFVGNGIAS
jgi:hypothetical protein